VAERRNSHNSGQSNLAGGERLDEAARLAQHYRACVSEIGVSRLLNFAWTGCGKGASGLLDVGDAFEVRSVMSRDRGLLVRTRDTETVPFVLALVAADDSVELLGWAMKDEVIASGLGHSLETDKPYWTLQVAALHPAATLPLWRRRDVETT
jgi:hypothetical protein